MPSCSLNGDPSLSSRSNLHRYHFPLSPSHSLPLHHHHQNTTTALPTPTLVITTTVVSHCRCTTPLRRARTALYTNLSMRTTLCPPSLPLTVSCSQDSAPSHLQPPCHVREKCQCTPMWTLPPPPVPSLEPPRGVQKMHLVRRAQVCCKCPTAAGARVSFRPRTFDWLSFSFVCDQRQRRRLSSLSLAGVKARATCNPGG